MFNFFRKLTVICGLQIEPFPATNTQLFYGADISHVNLRLQAIWEDRYLLG